MATITVTLSDAERARLAELAEARAVSPERLAGEIISSVLTPHDPLVVRRADPEFTREQAELVERFRETLTLLAD